MKRIIILTLAAGLLSVGTPALLAQVSTNTTGQTQSQTSDAKNKAADRRKLMKLIGLDAKELKGLAPDERRAKIKEATDSKIAELQKKQTDGTITAEEKSDLAFLQSRSKHGKGKSANAN